MFATVVTSEEELQQIVRLSDQNIRTKVSQEEKQSQGFVSWSYSFDLLQKMNEQHPHVVVKDEDKVIAYALVALKEARNFHIDLEKMIQHLDKVMYNGKKLGDYDYYVMGQICIDISYRSKGIF